MRRHRSDLLSSFFCLLCVSVSLWFAPLSPAADLEVGFGEADITPKLGKEPVYVAGFGQNRKATRVHDPLFARAIVLREGKRRIALASVDLVGFFRANVVSVRKQLPGFDYVLV